MIRKTRGNKWNKQICRRIASFLTITLLVNQSCFSVLAEEYENFEYTENEAVTATDEEAENTDASDEIEVNIDVDADANTNTESGIEYNTESHIGTDESEIIIPEYVEDENIIEEEIIESGAEDTINTVSIGDTFSDGNLKYKVTNDDMDNLLVEVTGHVDGISAMGFLEIPSSVTDGSNDYTVVCIGDYAFFGCKNLTDVIIPNSVLSIEYCAFADCKSLKNISIPNSVTYIGESAFHQCSNLEDITISNNVTNIESYTFANCTSLTDVTIPNRVTSIGESAFLNCSSLKSISIPNSVTSIGVSAFSSCSSIENISIPNNVTYIGDSAFQYCSSLTNIIIPESITHIEDYTFAFCRSLTNVTIPNNVVSIGNYTFGVCTSLINVTIPTSVTHIGASAFFNCTSLESITIPDSVVSIGVYAFTQCESLASVTILNDNISIGTGTFMLCNLNNFQIALSKDMNATPTIGNNCFSQCPADRSLTFLTEDGTTALSNSTTPTLAEAVKAYNAVNDGGINDGYWYGWKLPEADEVPDSEELFTITATAGTGGSITPSGAVKVKSGDSQQFTITPKDGYRVSSILSDGNEVLISEQVMYYSDAESSDTGNTDSENADAENSTKYYVFENVTDNHTLAAYFEPINAGDNNGPDTPGGNDTNDNNDPDDPGGDSSGGNDTGDNNTPDDSDSNNTGDSNIPVAISDPNVTRSSDIVSINATAPASKGSEPKTGYNSHIEVYATLAMIAGLSYLLLYFADGKNGMTEEEKKEIIASLVKWAQKGKRMRRFAALAVIFVVLVYYHSIGKRTAVEWKDIEWKAVYEK